jgi:aminopeptidase-like protein
MLHIKKNKIDEDIFNLAKKIFHLNRSLTGDGNRKTFEILCKYIPNLKTFEIKSGVRAFDWTIPKEWKVQEAHIITPEGRKICDYNQCNLHLVAYSIPFEGVITLEELNKHLYSRKDLPNAIPYVTSFYKKTWGFCISQSERNKLKKGNYKIVIKTKLFNGSMTYGEVLIKGKSKKEIFLSTYICHPSMANNEVSGPVVLTYLLKWLYDRKIKPKFSFRAIFIPETIGSIYYLSKNLPYLKKNVIAGMNITCVGDNRSYSILYSKYKNTIADKLGEHIIKWTYKNYKSYNWNDRGSDERQYCSPFVDLPFVSLMRSKHTEYPEYHTSLDTLNSVVTAEGLSGGFAINQNFIVALEKNFNPISKIMCEPMMSKRNLYPSIMHGKRRPASVRTIMNFLSWCDGKNSLLDIAEKINEPIWNLYEISDLLLKKNIIK